MTRRIATTAATMAALLLLPATAPAADSAAVNAGVLTYTSGTGTRDVIWVTDGGNKKHVVTDWLSPSFVPGANCVQSGLSVECSNATSASLSTLDGNDTVVVFSALPSAIAGGDGDDEITGGPSADTIDGGAGNDEIDVRNGGVDTVDCGEGIDTVQADAGDSVTNCNDPLPPADTPVDPAGVPVDPALPVAPPSVPAPQLPGDPATLPALAVLPVALATKEVRVGASGIATFELMCAPTEPSGCAGMVYLDPAPRAKRKPRALAARRGRYGRSKFEVASGGKARIRMSLTNAARRALGLGRRPKAQMARRGRRVKAVVTVTQTGKKPAKSNVTVKH